MTYQVYPMRLHLYQQEIDAYQKVFSIVFKGESDKVKETLTDVLVRELARELGSNHELKLPETAHEEIAILNTAIIKYGRPKMQDIEFERKSRRGSLDKLLRKRFECHKGKPIPFPFPLTLVGKNIYYDSRKEFVPKRSLYPFYDNVMVGGGLRSLLMKDSLQDARAYAFKHEFE